MTKLKQLKIKPQQIKKNKKIKNKKIEKKEYNINLNKKHKKHSKKKGEKYNNFIFLKKLKHFFNQNINTPFVVTNLKRFLFISFNIFVKLIKFVFKICFLFKNKKL